MSSSPIPKVMAVASIGGHWVQLLRLAPAWDGCRVTYVTTSAGLRSEALARASDLAQPDPGFRTISEANRWNPLRLLLCSMQMLWVALQERPDVIITTGAAPGFFAVRIGALLRIRTVWIDSIANAEEVSLSGQKAGKHATHWLTQWEHLASEGGPSFRGAVL